MVGRRSFFLIIGNAGGVDITFNGNLLESLGEEGKVVTVTLPESVPNLFRDVPNTLPQVEKPKEERKEEKEKDGVVNGNTDTVP